MEFKKKDVREINGLRMTYKSFYQKGTTDTSTVE